ncbi:MAG: response regulator [Leptospiraceae bacterium]|nr:response regulator [Leptospiraceae bacterium]
MIVRLLLPGLLFLGAVACSPSAPTVDLRNCLEVYTGSASGPQKLLHSSDFRKADTFDQNGFYDAPVWLRCRLDSLKNLEPARDYRLVLENGFIQFVDMYLYRGAEPSLVEHFRGGSSVPAETRTGYYRQPAFQLGPPSSDTIILMRLETKSRMRFPLSLSTESTYNQEVRKEAIIFIIYYGSLFLLFVSNLLGFAGLRHRYYLYINAFIFFLILYHSYLDQFWPAGSGKNTLIFQLLAMTGPLGVSALGYFLQEFLRPHGPGRIIDTIVKCILYSGLLAAPISLIDYQASIRAIIYLLPFWLILLSVVGLLVLPMRGTEIRYLAIALLISLPLSAAVALAEVLLDIDTLAFLPLSRMLIVPAVFISTISVTHGLARSARERQENLESAVRERTRQLMSESLRSEEAGKIKDNVLRIVSHDIRSPLAALKTNIPLLKRPDLPAETRTELLTEMESTVDQLLHLSNWLLESSRAGSGKPGLEPRWVSIRSILNEIADRYRKTVQNSGFSIQVNAPKWEVLIDPPLFSSMVSNLISNSIPHLGEEGSIQLLASLEDEFFLRIVDNGSGISTADQKFLFDPVITGQSKSSGTEGRGRGLGLILSREIALLHGGELELEQSSPGHTIFRFRMPRNRVYFTDSGNARGQSLILLVDDDPAFRQMIRSLFYQEDPELATVEASNTRQALRILREIRPRLIITDMWMPGEDGLHLIQSLAGDERYSGIPVWAISADPSTAAELKNYGNVKAFLPKPIQPDLIKRRFSDFVRENRR